MKGNSRERFVDIVNENGCLKVVFTPTNLCLGVIKCSRRGTPLDNARLIETVVKAFEVYMADIYGL